MGGEGHIDPTNFQTPVTTKLDFGSAGNYLTSLIFLLT